MPLQTQNTMKLITLIIMIICTITVCIGQKIITGDLPDDEIIYYCAPCGCPHDSKRFDSGGVCPACDMVLRPTLKGSSSSMPRYDRLTAAMLIFDQADIMDVTGPWSVMAHNGVNVITVAKSKAPVTIGTSMELMPDFTFESLPDVDILIFPGSGIAETNPGEESIQNFIKDRQPSTEVLFSVCSGAFFLAEAGVLNGQDATTFASLIPRLESDYPEINVLNNVKYVDNGKTVTSAGLSSGIDASFHVVSKFRGEGMVQDVANHMEYPWSRQEDYARSQLADNFFTGIKGVIELFAKEYVYSRGDRNTWEYRYILAEKHKPDKVLKMLNKELQKTSKWRLKSLSKSALTGWFDHNTLGKGIIDMVAQEQGGEVILKVVATRGKLYSTSSK